MESKAIRILCLAGLGLGVIVVLITILILTPDFLASHFDFVGTLDDLKTEEIQFDRYLAASIGALIAAISILYLVIPSWVNKPYNLATQLGYRLQNKNTYWLFCLACFLVALLLGFWGTMSGPGLSADSVTYMSVAESLHRGEGFNDYIRGGSYTRGAPLYPLIIAAFMHLGLDVMQAARLIPILSFAFMLTPLFFLNKKLNNVLNGYAVCLITLVFMQLLFLTFMAWTEMLYVLFSVLAILFITKYIRDDKAKLTMLCIAGVFSALAMLTRYIGILIVLVGLIAIVVNNKYQFKKFVPHALIYGLIAGIPVATWLYRNMILTSQLQGFDPVSSGVGLIENIKLTITTLLGGYSVGEIAHLHSYAFIIVAIIIVIVGLILYSVRKSSTEKAVWSGYLKNNYIIIAYAFIYIIAIIIIRANLFHGVEHRDIAPVYPFLTATIISFIFYAYTRIERLSIRPALFTITAIFCVSLILLQAGTSAFFLQNAKNGLGLNAPFWRNSPSLTWAKNNLPDNATIYSNVNRAVNLRLRKPSNHLPEPNDEKGIETLINDLNSADDIWIISFRNDLEIAEIVASRLSVADIAEINDKYHLLDIAAEFPEATIWHVSR